MTSANILAGITQQVNFSPMCTEIRFTVSKDCRDLQSYKRLTSRVILMLRKHMSVTRIGFLSFCVCVWVSSQTCHTPTIALAMRIRRMTKGSTKAVTVSSPSSNQARTWSKVQLKVNHHMKLLHNKKQHADLVLRFGFHGQLNYCFGPCKIFVKYKHHVQCVFSWSCLNI